MEIIDYKKPRQPSVLKLIEVQSLEKKLDFEDSRCFFTQSYDYSIKKIPIKFPIKTVLITSM